MASDIVKALFNKQTESKCLKTLRTFFLELIAFLEEEKKVLCQLLGKMYIPPEIDDDKIRTLKLLIHNLRLVRRLSPRESWKYRLTDFRWQRRPLRDTASNNALNRFDASISKKYEKQLEDFNEEEYRQLESLKELFEFLDDIFPEDDEEDEMPPKKRTRKRYVHDPSVVVLVADSRVYVPGDQTVLYQMPQRLVKKNDQPRLLASEGRAGQSALFDCEY